MIGKKSRHQEMKGLTSGGAFILGAVERGGSVNKDEEKHTESQVPR